MHPTYYQKSVITCVCGAHFSVGSTVEAINVEICSVCHPFYTGKQKLVDTARRVDKFQKRVALQESVGQGRKGRAVKRTARTAKKSTHKTLKLSDLADKDVVETPAEAQMIKKKKTTVKTTKK